MGFELESLALCGADVAGVAEAARQQDILLKVFPIDVVDRSVDGQTLIEPCRLRSEFIVPQGVGLETVRLRGSHAELRQ